MSLHHVAKVEAVLAEVRRVLRDDGLLIIREVTVTATSTPGISCILYTHVCIYYVCVVYVYVYV